MKIGTMKKMSVFVVICALGLTASYAFSQGKGKAKAKSKEKTETYGKHGREAGEMPYGLERYMENKEGELPSGLQKKKDEGGQLTRGLENGGKNLTSSSKGRKGSK